jgi:hypothetical protein
MLNIKELEGYILEANCGYVRNVFDNLQLFFMNLYDDHFTYPSLTFIPIKSSLLIRLTE